MKEFYNQHGGYQQNLLELGYPGLDCALEEYYETDLKRDSVILLSLPKEPFLKILAQSIGNLLEAGFRVVYKSHNGHLELQAQENAFVETWLDNPNFVYYTKANLELEELQRSITMIEFRSSMLYTYPIITKKPALMLQLQSEDFYLKQNIQDNFFEEKLHIKIFNQKEMVEVVKKLQKNHKFFDFRRSLIWEYCKNEAYCYGSSSQKIAAFIWRYYQSHLPIFHQIYGDGN